MINVIIEERAKINAKSYQVEKSFNRKIEFFKLNPKHPSLRFEPLKQGQGLWRFRITKKYWGITLKPEKDTIRVTNVIIHL